MQKCQFKPLDREGIFEVLRCASYCRLGVAECNQPYVIPMHYTWKCENGCLWFLLYSPACGEKMTCMRRNRLVALEFEMEGYNTLKTVVAKGRVIRFDEQCAHDMVAIEILTASISGREFFCHNGDCQGMCGA